MAAKYKLSRRDFIRSTSIALVFYGCKGNAQELTGNKPDKPGIDITPDPGVNLYGAILDNDGKPVEGVVVSDGFTCAVTDEKGIYQLTRNIAAKFVFYSTPAGYKVNVESASRNMPAFYKKVEGSSAAHIREDFQLTKQQTGETDFTLICIGDPQVTNQAEVTRFQHETINDLNATLGAVTTPAYGLSMGDVVGDQQGLLSTMKSLLGGMDMPVFTTIGNHDKFSAAGTPRTGDVFSNIYGPLDYSFNRGEVHFICMDNVAYANHDTYNMSFSDEQITWLQQDLSYVPKNKMVILYYHMPIGNSSVQNKDRLLQLFEGYAEVHFMCGHTHYNKNYIHKVSSTTIYEHIHGATCGAWWRSTVNGDGTPNGYGVYDIRGNSISNWYYKSTNYDKGFQMRLHWGDASFGGQYGYFAYSQPGNTLIANVWNADNDWKIEVYENGVKTGDMTPANVNKDAWAKGYHIGVLNRNPNNYNADCPHLFVFALKDPAAEIKVTATDRFGNQYEQRGIVTDFSTASSY